MLVITMQVILLAGLCMLQACSRHIWIGQARKWVWSSIMGVASQKWVWLLEMMNQAMHKTAAQLCTLCIGVKGHSLTACYGLVLCVYTNKPGTTIKHSKPSVVLLRMSCVLWGREL
jgi:hypothetical protein